MGLDSSRGQNRRPRGKPPAGSAIDGPLADGAALLRHYTLSDDDIEHIRAGGTAGWLSRSRCAFRFAPWMGPHPAHRRIPVAKTLLAALAYDSALYGSRPEDPKPFVWIKTGDQILANVARFCQRTLNTGH